MLIKKRKIPSDLPKSNDIDIIQYNTFRPMKIESHKMSKTMKLALWCIGIGSFLQMLGAILKLFAK